MATETIIWLIPLPPLLAFFLIVLFTNRSKTLSHSLAIGAAALSWLGSMAVFIAALRTPEFGKSIFASAINWLPTGDTFLKIGVQIDPLSAITLFFVAWTVLMIFIYSVGYHNFGQPAGDHDQPGLPPHGATVTEHGHSHTVPSVEPMYSRFFAFIGLFAFGMYTLVVSDNLLTLFVGWEIMGLCSYLLIGFWYAKKTARDAAIKAFMTTRVGDVFMLLGIALLYERIGSLNYRDIFYNAANLQKLANEHTAIFGLTAAGLIGLLLFIGTVGKSAQWPLHVWLPDAMEGPTPVSAMIHAATMVSAGVYMVIRIFPLFTADFDGHTLTTAMTVIAFIGAFTALFAATIAVAQNDIKKVLAYSTISQLGFMIAALGMGAYVAAAFHLVAHAFFKALLFLGSGSVIHGVEHGVLHTGEHVDPQDMFNMGGLRKKMPITFWTFLIGGFALSGFPLITAGFWSKDEILAEAFGGGHILVFLTLAVAALLTAFYTMRQITLTFLGEARTPAAEEASETPWTMTGPLVILSVFAIGFGWVGIPQQFPVLGGLIPNWFHGFVGATLLTEPEAVAFSWWPLLTSLVVALGGLGLGWLVYRNVAAGEVDPLVKPLGPVHTLLKNKYYFDEIYSTIFVKPMIWFCEVFTSQWMDRTVIDGILHSVARVALSIGAFLRFYFDLPVINRFFGDGSAAVVQKAGHGLRLSQAGRIQAYLISSLAVLIIVGAALYIFLPK
ncbi:MAG: NADH-quinone oxidoreductase subunit L [Anaerolineales bacterium]